MRQSIIISVIASLACLLMSVSAHAQRGVGGGGWSGYTSIPAGTKQITFDHFLIFDQDAVTIGDSDTTTTTRQLAWNGGLGFQYYLIENLGVGVSVGYLLDSRLAKVETSIGSTEATSTDSGFIGFATAEYYVRLGKSMFFRPGIGLGYFTGTREEPVLGNENLTASTGMSGFAGRLDLGGAFYASSSVSLRASISILARFGSISPDEEATVTPQADPTFTSIDAAFGLGVGYAF